MSEIVYLDPEIANEGEPATSWKEGWAGQAPIPDLVKLFGNHKRLGKYYAPFVFRPFPVTLYHATEESLKIMTAKA
jgi:hypothetical protein